MGKTDKEEKKAKKEKKEKKEEKVESEIKSPLPGSNSTDFQRCGLTHHEDDAGSREHG